MRCLIAASALLLASAATVSGAGTTTHPNFHANSMAMKAQARDHTKLAHQGMFKQIAQEMHLYKNNKEAGRAFTAQQGAEILAPVSTESQCTDPSFSTTMFAIFAICLVPLESFPMTLDYATDALSKTAWDTYCATTCVTELRSKLVGTNIEVCVHPTIKMFAHASAYFCDKTSTSGESCGVQYNRVYRYSGCSDYAVTTGSSTSTSGTLTCAAASDVCETYAGTSAPIDGPMAGSKAGSLGAAQSGCRAVMSTTVVSGICEGGCVPGFITLLKTVDPKGEALAGVKLLDSLLCSKASDGAWCANTIATSMRAFDDGTATKATFTTMCASAPVLGCYKKLMGVTSGLVAKTAKDNLVTCAIGYNNVSAYVNAACLPYFNGMMAATNQMRQMMSKLCIKNAAGDFCMTHQAALYMNPCYNTARSPYTQRACTTNNTACAASLQAQVTAMGCCAGTVQEAFTKTYEIVSTDYPSITGYTPTVMEPAQIGTTAPVTLGENMEATVSSGKGYLADLAFCGVTGLNETLRARCMLSTLKFKKSIGVKIRWSVLNSNAALKTKIKAALRADMANNCGVAVAEIINGVLTENTGIQITTATSRSMAVQTSTGSGVTYEFEIQAADEASTNAASSSFDTLDSENGFVMTETTSTTEEECSSSCTDDSGEMTESTSSGAAAQFFGGVVALVAVLATLF